MDTDSNPQPQSNGSSFVHKVPGGWWTIGIGAATVIIGGLTLNAMYSNNNANSIGTSGIPDTSAGGANSTDNQVGGAMDNQISNLLSQEQINQMTLQQILAGLPTTKGTVTQPTPSPYPTFIGRPIYGGTIPPWSLQPSNKSAIQPKYMAGTGTVQYGK